MRIRSTITGEKLNRSWQERKDNQTRTFIQSPKNLYSIYFYSAGCDPWSEQQPSPVQHQHLHLQRAGAEPSSLLHATEFGRPIPHSDRPRLAQP